MATRTAATLAILVEANTAAAQSNLRSVNSTLSRTTTTARAATSHTDRFSTATSKLGGYLKAAAAGAGSAALAYISISQAKTAITTTETLAKTTLALSRNLGLSTAEASRWGAVAIARGVDTDSLSTSFTTLSKNLELARSGSKAQVQAFRRLGLTQREVEKDSRNFSGLLFDVSEGLGAMEGGTRRAALAQMLLGRNSQTTLPIFTAGAEAMREQLQWADKYGVTLHGKTVKSIQELIDAQKELEFAQLGLQVQFTEKIAPALATAGIAVAHFINQVRTGRGAGGAFADVMTDVFHSVGDVIDVIKRMVQIMRPVLMAGLEVFKMFADNIKHLVRVIGDVLNLRFAKAWDDVRALFTTNVRHVIAILGDLTSPVRHIGAKIGNALVGAFKAMSKAVGRVWVKMTSGLATVGLGIINVVRSVADVIRKVVHFIVGAVNKAVDALGDLKDKIPSVNLPSLPSVDLPGPGVGVGPFDFNRGGGVPGVGNTDTVPAMLTPGEFVVRKEQAAKHRDLLEQINFQKYASGGFVGMQPGAAGLAKTFLSKFGGAMSSGFRPGDPGFHGRGQAFDWVGGNWGGATRYANQIGPQLLEGIHQGPPGSNVSWDSGHQVAPSFWGSDWASHVSHIHLAIAKALGALGKFAGAGQIGRFKIKGHGPLAGMTRAAAEHMRKAANQRLAQLGGGGLGAGVATGPIQQMARQMVGQIWGGGQWSPFNALEMSEAGWNPRAQNPSSGAAGLAQALPPSKYPAGAWPYTGLDSAKLQLQWMMGYIKSRYGTPAGAWAFHQAHNWYGNGGDFIARRPQLIGVGDRGPERVQVTPVGRGGGDTVVHVNFSGDLEFLRDFINVEIDERDGLRRQLGRMG